MTARHPRGARRPGRTTPKGTRPPDQRPVATDRSPQAEEHRAQVPGVVSHRMPPPPPVTHRTNRRGNR